MKVKKFQEGGAMPAQPAAPAGGEQDPIMQIASLAMEALETQNCEAAMAVCEAFIMLLQQSQGGGAQPVGEPPAGEPVFKKGGKIARREVK